MVEIKAVLLGRGFRSFFW